MDKYQDSSELLTDPDALRARAHEDGYLFLRGLLPRDRLLEVRRDILEILRRAKWVLPNAAPLEARARLEAVTVEGEPAFAPVYDEVQRLESFHSLAHAPELLGAQEALLGEPVLVHPRNIARIIFPSNVRHTTPPHQDYLHVQGTPETWTAWIPLGDCPRELGPLEVMAGSHASGIYPTHDAYGAGGRGVDTDPLPFAWVSGDFRLGDVLIFHSLTIHRALPNLTADQLRLSVDYRYQGLSRPVEPASLRPHHGRLTWEQVYQGWSSDRYQYYWRGLGLKLVPFDTSLRDLREPRAPLVN